MNPDLGTVVDFVAQMSVVGIVEVKFDGEKGIEVDERNDFVSANGGIQTGVMTLKSCVFASLVGVAGCRVVWNSSSR